MTSPPIPRSRSASNSMGKNAIVYLGTGGVATTLTEAGEWTLDVDFDEEEDTAFGDTWETQLKGILRASGTLAGNLDTAQANVFAAATATISVTLYLYPDRATTARYYYGNIWPKLSVNVPKGGVAKFSGSFKVDGQLAQN